MRKSLKFLSIALGVALFGGAVEALAVTPTSATFAVG